MRGSAAAFVISITLQVVGASRAYAEDVPAPVGTVPANGIPVPAASPPRVDAGDPAELAYNRAIALYASGDKTAALAAMEESYRLSQHPDLLYNVAKLERELGQCPRALASYRDYLQRAPSGAYRGPAQAAEHDLSRACGSPAPEQPSYWTTRRVIGWSAIGASAVAGAAAVYFAVSASASSDDANRAYQLAVQNGTPWSHADDEHVQDEARARTASLVSAVIAGTLAAGGFVLLVIPEHGERPPPSVSFGLQPGGAFVGYSNRF